MLAEAFLEQVQAVGSCLLWTGKVTNSGYGRFSVGAQSGECVHRWAYEQAEGPIPVGYDVHHVCANKLCARGLHLLAVPKDEHWMYEGLPLYCRQGHWLGGDGCYRYERPDGGCYRSCKACIRGRQRRNRERDAALTGRSVLPPTRERTRCPHGHAYDETNTGRVGNGSRYCKQCNRDNAARYYARRREGWQSGQPATKREQ